MLESLSNSLCHWLEDPCITVRMAQDEELVELRLEVERQRQELLRLRNMYAQECSINMRLQDILRQHGIKWR